MLQLVLKHLLPLDHVMTSQRYRALSTGKGASAEIETYLQVCNLCQAQEMTTMARPPSFAGGRIIVPHEILEFKTPGCPRKIPLDDTVVLRV